MLYSLQIFLYCWKGKASFSNGSSGGLGLISFSFRVGVFIICKEIPTISQKLCEQERFTALVFSMGCLGLGMKPD